MSTIISLQPIADDNAAPTSCTVDVMSGTSSSTAQTPPSCRICHLDDESLGENLISPCRCKGSLAWVHLTCLEKWLNQSCRITCELCGFKYQSTKHPRYSLLEGIRIWVRQPDNKAHIQADILVGLLLTLVTISLIAVSFIGMDQFLIEGQRLGVSNIWTKSVIWMFLTVIVFGYCVTLYLMVRDQYVPWHRWWTRNIDVHVTLQDCGEQSSKVAGESG